MLHNEEDKTRQGNLSDTYLLTTKIIVCIWMILTNPWLATEHTISMGNVPCIPKLLPVIKWK